MNVNALCSDHNALLNRKMLSLFSAPSSSFQPLGGHDIFPILYVLSSDVPKHFPIEGGVL